MDVVIVLSKKKIDGVLDELKKASCTVIATSTIVKMQILLGRDGKLSPIVTTSFRPSE
jgi:hypothetical protein